MRLILFVGSLVALSTGIIQDPPKNVLPPTSSLSPSLLTDDDMCELWVSHRIRQLMGGWNRRYQVVVWCRKETNPGDDSSISVTVSAANGQGLYNPGEAQATQETVHGLVAGIIENRGWSTRWPELNVAVL